MVRAVKESAILVRFLSDRYSCNENFRKSPLGFAEGHANNPILEHLGCNLRLQMLNMFFR
eukprot:5446334-Amphidinium_carterae.1